MSLLDFIKSKHHFIARERILHLKASLQMKIHAATYNEQIHISEPEIDNNGYDFVISSRYYNLYIQNKSTIDTSRVKNGKYTQFYFKPLSAIAI